MNRQFINSSNIRSIGYDLKLKILEIEFRTGSIYQYFGVTESTYNKLMNSSSHGSYFSRYIKNKYRWERIQ